jgi:SAM-dependent methyltransferase
MSSSDVDVAGLGSRLGSVAVAVMVLSVGAAIAAQQPPSQGGAQPPRDHMEHRFDDAERYAKSFDNPARDAWQMPARVIEALGLTPGQAVADIGAGTGYFSVRLARAVPSVTVYAVDVEPSMIAYLRKRAVAEQLKNIVAIQAAPDRPNLPQPVDVVLIVDTYHHLPGRVEYFRNLRQSLKPGARVAIVDFRKDAPEGPPVEFRFTAERIESELAQAGFRLVARHDFLPRQHLLVFHAGGPQ